MEGACASKPLLPTTALLRTAEMLSPRSMMRLPTWNQASNAVVQAARPEMDLRHGSLHGKKVCTTWKERCQQIKAEDDGIALLSTGRGEQLSEENCRKLCQRVRRLLLKEPNVLQVRAPVTIVGDLHGQFLDLLNILAVGGPMPESSYLFLGNYVNRGYDSLSTICLVFLLKARYPQRIALLRGNHESAQMTQAYGLYDECMAKYGHFGPEIWNLLCTCFNALPLSAVIEDTVLCLHAGLSPSIDTLDHIRALERDCDVPVEGPINDLLWTDPDDRLGWGIMPQRSGYTHGRDITEEFLRVNGLSLLVRSHQMNMEGAHWMHDTSLLNIWSAANYCNRCGNKGAIVELDEHMQRTIKTLEAVPWPLLTWPAA